MAEKESESQRRWAKYYQLSMDWPPREFLQKTVGRFDTAGFAIDLGSGNGTETLLLLEKGWHVLATDAQESAISTLLSRTPPEAKERLQTLVSSFETLDLPPADLIWAGNSLPFCHPNHFKTLWAKIQTALKPNGRFAGHLFGLRHDWFANEEMNFHSKAMVLALIEDMTLEYIIEEEGQQMTAVSGYQHWHAFAICARKDKGH